jgi:Ca2+/H+ antiporter, TMEM165/GDT1 family
MDIPLILLVFGVIFISELPDKSLLSSLILSSRYPGRYVWFGAASAFLVHVIIAISVGKALGLLPHRLLEAIISGLFLLGAIILLRGKHGLEEEPNKAHLTKTYSGWRLYSTAFGITFLSEWGDVTQITTANYAAKYHDPWSVGIGAVLALWSVAALAVIFGSKAINFISPRLLQRITAVILICFAAFNAYLAIK